MKRSTTCAGFLLVYLIVLMLFSAGCSLQLVAPYDARTEEQIFMDAGLVDRFYSDLQDCPEEIRAYAAFGPGYREIEAELRTLVLRNKVRRLNEDSTEITLKILDQWVKCKERHRKQNSYKDAIAQLDRERFQRMFEYAARAEGAKAPAD